MLAKCGNKNLKAQDSHRSKRYKSDITGSPANAVSKSRQNGVDPLPGRGSRNPSRTAKTKFEAHRCFLPGKPYWQLFRRNTRAWFPFLSDKGEPASQRSCRLFVEVDPKTKTSGRVSAAARGSFCSNQICRRKATTSAASPPTRSRRIELGSGVVVTIISCEFAKLA